jgi:hypothetical protein
MMLLAGLLMFGTAVCEGRRMELPPLAASFIRSFEDMLDLIIGDDKNDLILFNRKNEDGGLKPTLQMLIWREDKNKRGVYLGRRDSR